MVGKYGTMFLHTVVIMFTLWYVRLQVGLCLILLQADIKVLGLLNHLNLVKVIGYYLEDDHNRLLVSE